ncbi:MAG: DUF1552 domain-containing protein, partial [Planctomycetota bacterium]
MSKRRLRRRHFLRAAGVSLALPHLASACQAGDDGVAKLKRGASVTTNAAPQGPPRRMVCIGNMLGFYPGAFWPKGNGSTYEMGETTASLQEHRGDLTFFSGLEHPGVKGGHFAIHAFLSGVRHIDAASMPDANVTIDQYAASRIAGQTRFPSLTIGSETGIHGGCMMSWTRTGIRVPPIAGPRQLFDQLFVDAGSKDKQLAHRRFQLQQSILDAVGDNARSLKRHLNQDDKHKLEEYFTSVRDVEQRLGMSREWIDIPKPKASIDPPKNRRMVQDLPLLYDLILLALQTDSTRIATLEI